MRTRNKFHHALRKAAEMIKTQKLFEATLLGGGDIVQELKEIFFESGKYGPHLPETVAGAIGEAEKMVISCTFFVLFDVILHYLYSPVLSLLFSSSL